MIAQTAVVSLARYTEEEISFFLVYRPYNKKNE